MKATDIERTSSIDSEAKNTGARNSSPNSVQQALDLAVVVKALADPTRLRIVDAVRKSDPEALCQCDLLPFFDMSQAAVAKHLKVLVTAGVLASERRGAWMYYYLRPGALKELTKWLR